MYVRNHHGKTLGLHQNDICDGLDVRVLLKSCESPNPQVTACECETLGDDLGPEVQPPSVGVRLQKDPVRCFVPPVPGRQGEKIAHREPGPGQTLGLLAACPWTSQPPELQEITLHSL